MEVPTELAFRHQWILWRMEDGNKKIPYQVNGRKARSNDPETWSNLSEAISLVSGYSGLGFVFAGDELFGIDLDGCRNPQTGEIAEWAKQIIAAIPTYAEVSPSGTGVKLYGKGTLSFTGKKKVNAPPLCDKLPAIEAYCSGRYFAFTGECLDGGISEVETVDPNPVLAHFFAVELKPVLPPTFRHTGTHKLSDFARCLKYLDTMPAAIEGDGGGTATFQACKAIAGFALDGVEARAAFDHYNARCVPPWEKEKEITYKIAQGKQHGAWGALRDAAGWIPEEDWGVDLSFLLDPAKERPEDADDDEFCESMVPREGLLREIYDFYTRSIYRQCPVFALATAISVCQSLFGRKVESETGMRTNDYHLILAPTTSGKEGTLTAVNMLFTAAGCPERILPEKMQSGNGLLAAVKEMPSCIWVCDEFGYVLQSILDKKKGDLNARAIGGILLSLYGKSNSVFTGSAYAGKKDHAINQPHLCVLGVSTGYTVFNEITQGQVMDGMLGRVSFWSVQSRPKPNRNLDRNMPEILAETIRAWDQFSPGGNLGGINPSPVCIPFSEAAQQRWREHEDKIDLRMENERAIRSALWGRAAARSMKLALTHRMARLSSPAEINEFNDVRIELCDINWGIAVSNWNTRLACSLIGEQIADTVGISIQKKVSAIIQAAGEPIRQRQIFRALRSADKGQITAAINELEQMGRIKIEVEQTGGRPATLITWVTKAEEAKSA